MGLGEVGVRGGEGRGHYCESRCKSAESRNVMETHLQSIALSVFTAMTCALIQQTERKYARKQVSDHELSPGFRTRLKTEPSVLPSGEGFEPN